MISQKISRYLIPLCVYFLSLCLFVQSVHADGSASTLPGQEPGTPVGSFTISNLDTVNLFNGHLNFRLPLIEIGGRGQASFSLGLPVDHRWVLTPTSPDTPDTFNPAFIPFTSLTPGFLRARHLSQGCNFGVNFFTDTHTVLIFTTQNGSQVELRDSVHSGQPALSECNPFQPNTNPATRGRTFSNDDGSFTFISDSTIFDMSQATNPIETKPSGYLLTKDGARYRINTGRIQWLRDRNGNLLTFSYDGVDRLTGITDSLNRQITIAYTAFEPNPFHVNVTFKGFGGAVRTINIEYGNLSDLLVEGSITTYQGLFGIGPNTQFNPWLVKLVRLPDNRTYQLRYNKYGELSRVDLPTSGAFTYQWASGNPQNQNGLAGKFIDRRVIKKTIYKDAVNPIGSTSFGLFETHPSGTSGDVKLRHLNQADAAITDEKHYFHGVPIDNTNHPFGYTAPPIIGREYQTDSNTADGSTLLRRIEHTFDLAGINIIETLTTLADVSPNLKSKRTFVYGLFNNLTDVYEYDFGQGAPGSFLRRTHTEYITNSTYTGTDFLAAYAGTAANLRSLPSQRWISSDLAGNNKKSLIAFEYDVYTTDSLHAALTPRSDISGLCTTFNATGTCSNTDPTGFTLRGNVTAVTSYANAANLTGAVTFASQYDIAGNVVKAIDQRGFATQFSFADCFGSPDANAQNCGGAAELGSQVSYAFATTVTNALNHISRTQFDYYLGKPVDTADANAVVISVHYDDALDRTRKVIRAANQGTSVRSQTVFDYDDPNKTVTTSTDLDTFDDKALVSKVLYDGLGRTRETRQFEGGTNYIVTEVEYDALSRPFKTSNPYRPWQSQSAVWTTKVFDALGRVISLTTPDNAVVTSEYKGNRVLVTDPQGKKRMSNTNAAGQLKEVFEVTPNDTTQYPGIETDSFAAQTLHGYKTQYHYDVMDNLAKVIQGTQQRFFMHDSLNRLIRTRTPEQDTRPEFNLLDPVTMNSEWSVKYEYDNNGNLERKTDPRNIATTLAYDALNRNTSVNYSNTTIGNPDVPDIQRFYDRPVAGAFGTGRFWYSYAGGNETVGSNVEKTTIETYDALGRPKSLGQNFKFNGTWTPAPYQTERDYDLAGNVTSQTYPSGHSVDYSYDTAGRTDNVEGNLGDGATRTYSAAINYSEWGSLARERFGTATAVYHKSHYNIRGQLFDVRVSNVNDDWGGELGALVNYFSTPAAHGGSGPDNNGSVQMSQTIINSFYVEDRYTYDALNRLSSVAEYQNGSTHTGTQAYKYDRWGNRTIHLNNTWGTDIPEPNFGVNAAKNQLTAPAGFSMNYDSAGNLTTDTYSGAGERVYNAENRMTQARGGDNQLHDYTYDADGHRTRRKLDGQETWQIYGFEGELLAEYAVNGAHATPQKEYGYRNGQLLIAAEPAGNPTLPLFADDFNDNSLDTSKWTIQYPGGTPSVTEESQQLKITLAPSTAGYNGVYSNANYDLTGRMVQVEVAQAVSQAGWCENMLELELNANNYFLINVGAGSLLFRARVNGVNDQTSIGFDPVAHRHWRIRHNSTANTINFETSADATVWITRKTVTPAFSLTSLRIYLIAGAYGNGNSAPGVARYDNLKLLSSVGGPSSITIPNAGFETPALGFGNFQYGPTGGSWSFINGGGISAGGSGFTGGSFVPEGNQIAFIQSNGEFSQSLSGFQANTNYVISFWAAQRTNCCNAGGQQFSVYLDGTLLGTFNPTTNGVYLEYSTPTFTTTAGAHTVKFVGLNPGGQTAFIDHVRITGSPVIGNGVQWFVADHLGTPRMILDESGSLSGVKRHDYLPFGEELFGGTAQDPGPGGRLTSHGYTAAGDSVRQKFTSKERDNETGLDYFNARYYASGQGRFASTDPYNIFFEMRAFTDIRQRGLVVRAYISEPQNWNRYTYSINDPINLTDPSGLIWLTQDNKTFIWVDDADYSQNQEKYKDYTVGNGRVVQFVNASDCAQCKGLKQGDWIRLNENGTIDPVAEPSTNDPPMSGGYTDINFSFGSPKFIGLTGGIMFNPNGVYPYFGGGFMLPGPGASVTMSNDNVSGGFNFELQGGRGPLYGSVGWDQEGNTFLTHGAGSGASATVYYVFGAPHPTPGPHKPFNNDSRNSNSNSSGSPKPGRSNCACNNN